MKTNQRMETLVKEVRQENLDDPRSLPERLHALLNAGFVEETGSLLLRSEKERAHAARLDFPDATGYECFVNHIHIKDYLEGGGLPPLAMLGCGLAFAQELNKKLFTLFGKRHFRIIVSFDGSDCTVRFHTVRVGEQWVAEDLDGYREESIAIIDT